MRCLVPEVGVFPDAVLRRRTARSFYDVVPVSETVYLLEMTAAAELVPTRARSPQVELKEVGAADARLIRSTYTRIGAPLGWGGRMDWSEAQWRDELSKPGVRAWIALVYDDVAGLVELEAQTTGDVGIVIFGLVPEFVGLRFGGVFLTLATELAWQLPGLDGARTKRVWVQTSSKDHPHALPNYEARGFRTYRTQREKEGQR